MMGILGTAGKSQETAIAIFVVAFLLWYFCIIIIPAIPNANCPGLSTSGASGGSSGGGSCGDGSPCMCPTCPTCDEPDPAPAQSQPYCYYGVKCPVGGYDTFFGTCRCSTGYFWDTGLQLCCPTQELA